MRFVETPVFTEVIVDLLDDEDYHEFQMALVLQPDQGALIRGSGGLRKVRWKVQGRGKRGGIRAIYYWQRADDEIFLLYAYEKGVQEDLTPNQLRVLKQLVKKEFK